MKPHKFFSKRRAGTDMTLQITSMADVFVILLVFLLKSYFTGTLNISPSVGMRLPQAKADGERLEALKVEISEAAVQLDDKPVSELAQFRFSPKDIQPRTGLSLSLESAIRMARKRQDLIARSNPEVKSDEKILLLADQSTPYVTIKTVALTAAVYGYTDVKLIVVKK